MSSHVYSNEKKNLLHFSTFFQEGPQSISVWNLGNRTTCAVEAINGVIGRGIPGNSNFIISCISCSVSSLHVQFNLEICMDDAS